MKENFHFKVLMHNPYVTFYEDELSTIAGLRKATSTIGVRGDPTSSDAKGTFEMRPAGVVAENGFRSNQEKPLRGANAGRAAYLHNVGTRGKPYDIISGVATALERGCVQPRVRTRWQWHDSVSQ